MACHRFRECPEITTPAQLWKLLTIINCLFKFIHSSFFVVAYAVLQQSLSKSKLFFLLYTCLWIY